MCTVLYKDEMAKKKYKISTRSEMSFFPHTNSKLDVLKLESALIFRDLESKAVSSGLRNHSLILIFILKDKRDRDALED